MKDNITKIVFGLFVLILILIGIVFWSGPRGGDDAAIVVEQQQEMQVHFLNVGQGDSIYIRTPSEQDILIDGGPDKNVLAELGAVMPFWDKEIDVMVLSHPHSDHVTGLVEVLRRYKVKEIYYTGVLHTAPDYLAWLDEVKKQELDLKIVEQPFEIDFGNEVKLQFLYPRESLVNKKIKEMNNSSIVNKLVYRDVSFLFTGDAELEVEEALLATKDVETQNFASLRATVLKAGHHASSSSSSEEFLKAVNPETVVIQVGADNSFGHPHLKILRRLERLGVEILRNDEKGRILITTDGQDISFE
ncbi:MBL fold metallo-hydrolase [Candidatus Kuenenbacteria bacterium]|nr:MBL fold metallo-hydrolase [Candidatus Kuenenbacteria bacterium]